MISIQSLLELINDIVLQDNKNVEIYNLIQKAGTILQLKHDFIVKGFQWVDKIKDSGLGKSRSNELIAGISLFFSLRLNGYTIGGIAHFVSQKLPFRITKKGLYRLMKLLHKNNILSQSDMELICSSNYLQYLPAIFEHFKIPNEYHENYTKGFEKIYRKKAGHNVSGLLAGYTYYFLQQLHSRLWNQEEIAKFFHITSVTLRKTSIFCQHHNFQEELSSDTELESITKSISYRQANLDGFLKKE